MIRGLNKIVRKGASGGAAAKDAGMPRTKEELLEMRRKKAAAAAAAAKNRMGTVPPRERERESQRDRQTARVRERVGF